MARVISDKRHGAQRFTLWLALGYMLFALAAFSGTYWVQWPRGTFSGAPVLHLHAALFTGWMLLLVWQAWLASRGRIARHRDWGMAGIALATAMLFMGVATALYQFSLQLPRFGDAARVQFVLPLSAIAGFTIFYVLAMFNIRRPEWHKRFMLVATVALLEAAFARLPFYLQTGGGGPDLRPGVMPLPPTPLAFVHPITLGSMIYVLVMLSPALVRDWRLLGRPHAAYTVGIAKIISIQIGRVPLSTTTGWNAFVDFLARFSG
jgi:hypothetical protein